MFKLQLTTPSFSLRDHSVGIKVRFRGSMICHMPSQRHMDTMMESPTFPIDMIHLIRDTSMVIHLRMTYNQLPVSPSFFECWTNLITISPIWRQLGFKANIVIPPKAVGTTALLKLCRSSYTETQLPQVLPEKTATVGKINMSFQFVSNVCVSTVTAKMVMPLTDSALRSYWEETVAVVAPLVGLPGLLEGIEKRSQTVSSIAEVLNKHNPKQLAQDREQIGDAKQKEEVESSDTEHEVAEENDDSTDESLTDEKLTKQDEMADISPLLWDVLVKETLDEEILRPLWAPGASLRHRIGGNPTALRRTETIIARCQNLSDWDEWKCLFGGITDEEVKDALLFSELEAEYDEAKNDYVLVKKTDNGGDSESEDSDDDFLN